MAKTGTMLQITDLRNPKVEDLLRAADQIGTVEVMAGGKLYQLTASDYKENPVAKGSPFAKFKPIPVNMTSRELSDLIAEMRGE